jgi:type VI secretion system secreted protein Hcp
MSIEGEKQGKITAKCGIQKGHEDEVIVQAFQHQVTTPTDPQSGQPTGQRVHKPFVVTKVFDRSSPMLYQAMCTGERMKTVELHWFITVGAQMKHYFTHKLTDAIIVDIQARMPNCQDPSMAHFTHLEDVSFTYRAIEWTQVADGVSAVDDWQDKK